MKVSLAEPHAGRVVRAQYMCWPNIWALPIMVGLQHRWTPGRDATFEMDERWLETRILVVHVLCFVMKVVISGPLLPYEGDDE